MNQPSSSSLAGVLQAHPPNEQTSSLNPEVKPKGEDYVYFERTTSGFTADGVARSTAAKLKLESYYKVAVDSAIERNTR